MGIEVAPFLEYFFIWAGFFVLITCLVLLFLYRKYISFLELNKKILLIISSVLGIFLSLLNSYLFFANKASLMNLFYLGFGFLQYLVIFPVVISQIKLPPDKEISIKPEIESDGEQDSINELETQGYLLFNNSLGMITFIAWFLTGFLYVIDIFLSISLESYPPIEPFYLDSFRRTRTLFIIMDVLIILIIIVFLVRFRKFSNYWTLSIVFSFLPLIIGSLNSITKIILTRRLSWIYYIILVFSVAVIILTILILNQSKSKIKLVEKKASSPETIEKKPTQEPISSIKPEPIEKTITSTTSRVQKIQSHKRKDIPFSAMTDDELLTEYNKYLTSQKNLEERKDSTKKVLYYKLMAEYEEKLEKLREELDKRGIEYPNK